MLLKLNNYEVMIHYRWFCLFNVAFVFSDKCMDIVSTAMKDSKDDTKERLSPSKELLRKLQQVVTGPTAGGSKTTPTKKRKK